MKSLINIITFLINLNIKALNLKEALISKSIHKIQSFIFCKFSLWKIKIKKKHLTALKLYLKYKHLVIQLQYNWIIYLLIQKLKNSHQFLVLVGKNHKAKTTYWTNQTKTYSHQYCQMRNRNLSNKLLSSITFYKMISKTAGNNNNLSLIAAL